MEILEKKIFKGITLADLFEEIHSNSTGTRDQIKTLIGTLTPLVTTTGDATLLVPLIKEYMEIGVKNDELLVKLATIIQRLESGSGKAPEDPFGLSEIQKLLDEQLEVENSIKEVDHKDEV